MTTETELPSAATLCPEIALTGTIVPRLFTDAQTAKLLSPEGDPISKFTVRRLRLRGELGFIQVGRKIFHSDAQIAAYLKRVSTDPESRARPVIADTSPKRSGSGSSGARSIKEAERSTRNSSKAAAMRLALDTLNQDARESS